MLVGLMATGKTSAGRRLAERLGRDFVDSDAQVVSRTGRSVREIFESDGEAAFRRLEAEALAEALGRPAPVVVGAAGGVVLDAGNRARLADAVVIWLRAEPATLARRVTTGDHRPLLGDNPQEVLETMLDQRRHLYAEVAGHRQVDVETLSVDEVVDAVMELIG